jgi:hypothetical protein
VADFVRYLTEIVDPTVKDFEANPGSVRHAFLACVAAFHAIDYLAFDRETETTRKGRVTRLRQTYGARSPDFKIVDEVAHAFKHAIATGPRGSQLKSDDVLEHRGVFSRDFSPDFDRHRVTVRASPKSICWIR